MTELHVIPDDRTTWRVYEAGASSPLSEHTNATDAELAALAWADDRERVVVHDRYHRTHEAGRAAGARPNEGRRRGPSRREVGGEAIRSEFRPLECASE